MTVIVPTYPKTYQYSTIPLVRYAQIAGIPECAFFGVYTLEDDLQVYDCPNIWSEEQRNELSQALWGAQRMIEKELTYPIYPQFFEAEEHKVNSSCFLLDWRHIIGAGVKAVTDYGNQSVVYVVAGDGTITGTVSVVLAAGALTGVSTEEIRVYHPGTDAMINPSSVEFVTGINDTINIEIPRCRLVDWDQRYNPIDGYPYADDTYFEETVDITREYLDTSNQASFRKLGCPSSDCSETLAAGCVRVKKHKISSVELRLTATGCGVGDYVDINYQAGLTEIPLNLEEAVIRLAHSLMVATPCPCEGVMNLWLRDRDIPDGAELERSKSKFGISNGAWFAWIIAQEEKIFGGSNLA